MLVLLFYLGDVKYTIRCEKVREIAPMVMLKHVMHAPDYFAGLFNYRGIIVPVIDLRQLIQGTPCDIRLSTRIILIDYQKPGTSRLIVGLMAERVTEAVMKPQEALIPARIRVQNAPYLGGIIMEQDAMIHYVDVDILPESLQVISMLEQGKDDAA